MSNYLAKKIDTEYEKFGVSNTKLDLEGIAFLERFLKSSHASAIIVSHDRRFLDRITKRTLEISFSKIYDYNVPFSQYKQLSKERREQQIAAYENQQSKIKHTEKFIEKFRAKATKATQVQSRVKMLNKTDIIEIEPEDKRSINFHFPPAPRAGDIVIETKELTKKYGDLTVIKDIDFTLERGEKVAFVGKNGEGKTTLARIFNNELEFDGTLKVGHNVTIGYYAQNQDESLDKTRTVFETLDDIAVGDIRKQLRKILVSFLFSNDDVDKKVSVLSGGERARLALAKLILQPYSLLILDEPTNHLDMPAKDILKKALIAYDGTIILVSHDRDFLEDLSQTVYEFKNQKIKQFKGDINYFLEKKKLEFIDQLNIKKQEKEFVVKKETASKNEYLLRKEKKRQLNKFQKEIKQIEIDIDTLENKISKDEEDLANPEKNQNGNFYEEYELAKIQLERKMTLWEDLHLQLENFKNKNL